MRGDKVTSGGASLISTGVSNNFYWALLAYITLLFGNQVIVVGQVGLDAEPFSSSSLLL